MVYLPTQFQCQPVLPGNWGRNKISQKGTQCFKWDEGMKICTGLPRMVPVYTCYPSIINSTVLHPQKCPSLDNMYVTSVLDCKHVMPRITLRAIKATEFHILMNLYLTAIKKGCLKLAEGWLQNDRVSKDCTQWKTNADEIQSVGKCILEEGWDIVWGWKSIRRTFPWMR